MKLLEELSALEHTQWETWAQAVAPEVSEARRERWQKYFVPYEYLAEDVKEHDRKWARKVIEVLDLPDKATLETLIWLISEHQGDFESDIQAQFAAAKMWLKTLVDK